MPSSVSFFMLSLNKSPVEICGIPNLKAIFFACVPLPAPGGPKTIIFMVFLAPHYTYHCETITDMIASQ